MHTSSDKEKRIPVFEKRIPVFDDTTEDKDKRRPASKQKNGRDEIFCVALKKGIRRGIFSGYKF